MSAQAMTDYEIATALGRLPGWSGDRTGIAAHYKFSDFRAAMSFLLQVAIDAEILGHHPEIHNVYNRVKLTLRTHDAGDLVTALDVGLAERIVATAQRFQD